MNGEKKKAYREVPVQVEFDMERPVNIFDHIKMKGDDKDFVPMQQCRMTPARPGSSEKIKTLRYRLDKGYEMWHEDDPSEEIELTGYEQITGRKLA